MHRAAVLPLSFALAACSSSSSPGQAAADGGASPPGCPTANTVTGTLGGRTLAPGSAAGVLGLTDSSYPNQLTILISNQSNVCGLVQTLVSNPNELKANLLDLAFTLGPTSPDAPPVTVGTYSATSQNELTAGYDSYDATCTESNGGEQTAGQVVLCSVGSTYTGTFDLTFGADHVTGTFVAPSCTVAQPGGGTASGDGGTVCEP